MGLVTQMQRTEHGKGRHCNFTVQKAGKYRPQPVNEANISHDGAMRTSWTSEGSHPLPSWDGSSPSPLWCKGRRAKEIQNTRLQVVHVRTNEVIVWTVVESASTFCPDMVQRNSPDKAVWGPYREYLHGQEDCPVPWRILSSVSTHEMPTATPQHETTKNASRHCQTSPRAGGRGTSVSVPHTFYLVKKPS